jgi:hypothetical protein
MLFAVVSICEMSCPVTPIAAPSWRHVIPKSALALRSWAANACLPP